MERDLEKDIDAEWDVISDKKVQPLDPKYQKIPGMPGALLKITFYKSYGKSKNSATGEIVDSVHYLCHEFPFFVLSLPEIYESKINGAWKTAREFVYQSFIGYLNDSSKGMIKHFREPAPGTDRWIDDYSTFVVLC